MSASFIFWSNIWKVSCMHWEGICNNIAVTGDTAYFSNTYHQRHPCCLFGIPFTYVVSNPIGQKPSGYISQKCMDTVFEQMLVFGGREENVYCEFLRLCHIFSWDSGLKTMLFQTILPIRRWGCLSFFFFSLKCKLDTLQDNVAASRSWFWAK